LEPLENNTLPVRPTPPRVWPVFGALIGVFLIQALGGAALALGLHAWRGTDLFAPIEPTVELVVILAAFTSMLFAAVALTAGALSPTSITGRLRLGFARRAALITAASVVGFTALSAMLDAILALVPWRIDSSTLELLQEALRQASGANLLGAILFIGPMTGLGEELFFRGFVQTRLRERWGRWPAIVGASLAFGLYHFDPVHSSLAFLSGLLLGWIVEASGSLWPAVAAHAVNNSVAVILTALLPEPSRAVEMWLLTASLPITLLAVAFLMRTFRRVGAPVPGGLS